MPDLSLEPGATISHFRLEKKLGEGGMGAVYLAEDLTLSRRVAIKFMSRALLAQVSNPSVRESIEKRFIREARSAAAINHPNLAQIYEANFESDNWYIAMEFIDGSAIDSIIESGRQLSVQEIIGYTRQIIAGLQHAWEYYKIVHRDIKPANIMITRQDIIKIVDLGLAKPMTSKDEEDGMPDITCAGTPIGTPQYMAPEQATGETDINNKVDIFALGATLYELAAGKKCFNERTAPLIYMAQMQKKYVRLKEIRPEIPDGFSELIDAMLEPSAMERISDYDEILARLDTLGTMVVDLGSTAMATAPAKSLAGPTTSAARGGAKRPAPTSFYPSDHLILDRFRVIRPIGKSRAGHVYLCMDTQLGVECAMKTLYPDREFEASEMGLIKDNFQRLLGMSHPELVQIRDLRSDSETGELYVVMELLNGRNLREFTHKRITEMGSLDLATVLPVAERIAKSLDSANRSFGMVHHDLKPESIYLTSNDTRVKLLDFGITTRPMPETTRIEPGSISMKALPLSNPDYMAPEIWQDLAPSLAADQYSLAVVIYEMLSRKLPFWLRDPSIEELAQKTNDKRPLLELQMTAMFAKVLNQKPAPIASLSKSQNAVLLRALSKNPAERFPTCQAFVEALAKAGSGSKLKMPLIIAASVCVLVGGGAAMALLPSKAKTDLPLNQQPLNTQVVNGGGTTTTPVTPINTVPTTTDTGVSQVITTDPHVDTPTTNTTPEIDIHSGTTTRPEFVPTQGITDAQRAVLEQRMVTEIERLKGSLAELTTQLKTKEPSKDQLAELDAAEKAAAAALAGKDFKQALTLYKKAEDLCVDLELAADAALGRRAADAAKALADSRAKTEEFDTLDAKIAELAAELKMTASLADKHVARKEYADAIAKYDKALELNKKIEATVKGLFKPTNGKDFTVPKVGMDFVWIEGMNAWVGRYEVTNKDYRNLKNTHNSKKIEEGFSLNDDNQPVVRVSYFECVAYCSWMTDTMDKFGLLPEGYTFRLPTKKEWLYYATCGKERAFPWGNDWPPPSGNFGNQEMFPDAWDLDPYEDKYPATCPVDQSGKNEWGLFGVAGNVWEWTTDDREGKKGVYGGSWTEVQQAALRTQPPGGFNYADPAIKDFDNIGFRIILAPKPDED